MPGSVGRVQWPLKASICWMREMLSVRRFCISTKCPARILSTKFGGNGSDAGDKLNPGAGSVSTVLAECSGGTMVVVVAC